MRFSDVVIVFLVFLLAVSCTLLYKAVDNYDNINHKIVGSVRYEPDYASETGPEILFIYIGSSECGWSTVEYLPSMIKDLKEEVKDYADARNYEFSAIGIAAEWSVDEGISHLSRFGGFDEIIAGRNWDNTGVAKYVWQDITGPASTPQILVVRRQLISSSDSTFHTSINPRLITRKVGILDIRNWYLDDGALPKMSM